LDSIIFAAIFMQVHYSIEQLPKFHHAVITIGTFDGVHLGHHAILAQLQAAAQACEGETVIITFDPHPRTVVRPDQPLFLLTTLEEKVALLEAQGIDHLVVVPFTPAFSHLSPEAYVADFLWKYFHPHTLIMGYDHQFGKDRSGNYEVMESLARKYGFELIEISPTMLEAAAISSTRIRKAISTGAPAMAQQLLGYPYSFSGIVITGNKLGRTIGYPTANIQIPQAAKLIPANGVYAVSLRIKDWQNQLFTGMMNIGYRPTVAGQSLTIEVHIFDFDQDIYDQELTVMVHQYLRTEVKFSGLDALKKQLALDAEQAKAFFQEN
jgi:riboflavin kinase / FMN adenylyltransferase